MFKMNTIYSALLILFIGVFTKYTQASHTFNIDNLNASIRNTQSEINGCGPDMEIVLKKATWSEITSFYFSHIKSVQSYIYYIWHNAKNNDKTIQTPIEKQSTSSVDKQKTYKNKLNTEQMSEIEQEIHWNSLIDG